MNWHYIRVNDGNDISAIKRAIKRAQRETNRPTIIEIKTIIGYMSPLAGLSDVHGAPLGEEKTNVLKDNLGYNNNPFEIDEDVYDFFKRRVYNRGNRVRLKWRRLMKAYKEEYPELYQTLINAIEGKFEVDLSLLPRYEVNSKAATRNVGGKIIQTLSNTFPTLIGGSADLTKSTKAKGIDGDFDYNNRIGRNINFGVRNMQWLQLLMV